MSESDTDSASDSDADSADESTEATSPDEPTDQQDSDESTDETSPDQPTAQMNADEPTDPTTRQPSTTDFELRKNFYRGVLGLFVLLAVVAVVQLYASVNATINTFISQRYRPLFRAAFNLVVLLIAGIGISWSVRELSGE